MPGFVPNFRPPGLPPSNGPALPSIPGGGTSPYDASGRGLPGGNGGFGDTNAGKTIKWVVDAAGKILPVAVAAYSAYQGAKASGKSDELQGQALDFAKEAYADRAPLRHMGMQRLTNPQTANLSHLFASNAGNPYYQPPAPGIPKVNGTGPLPASAAQQFPETMAQQAVPSVVAGSQSATGARLAALPAQKAERRKPMTEAAY